MKTINQKDRQITFTAGIDESLANAIRRYIDQIQVIAVDEVEISKNDSPLYDETIAHRIGLIPLENKGAKEGEQLTLTSKGGEGMVYSGELKGKIKPVYDKLPITILKKGQELEILCTTKFGKGSEHAKFSPGLMYYRNLVKIKIDKDCPKEIVNSCPLKILKAEDGKISVVDENKCDMCESCIEYCKKHGKKGIELIPAGELIITVESFGQMPEEEIFRKAIDALKKDLEEVSKKVSK